MKFRKNLAAVLALAMLASVALTGCGDKGTTGGSTTGGSTTGGSTSTGESAATEASFINLDGSLPIITDPAAFEEANGGKLSMLIVNDASRTVEVSELLMVQRWKEETGIEFDWQVLSPDGATEKLSLMLTSGDDLPDCFWNFIGGQSGTFAVQYADQDVFIPTEDLIQKYVPTLAKILEDNPKYKMEVTTPDGHSYGFPYIEEMKGLVLTGGPMMMNQNWLDQVGMELPTTVDEFTEVLRAFKNGGDLNGNGVEDEIPLATWFGAHDTFGSYDMFYRFTNCFGQADSYCEGNPYADHMAYIDGKIVFTGLNESVRKTADYFHMLYSEGLLNKDCFVSSSSSTNYTNNEVKQDIALLGCMGLWTDMEIINNDVRHEYSFVPQLTGEAGVSGFANNYSELQDSSDTCITTECKYPEVIACFVEYMISDPKLSIQSNWGAEGYNYHADENGMLTFHLDERGDIIPVEPWSNFGEMRVNTTPCRGSMIILDEYYDVHAQYTYDAKTLLEGQYVNGKEEQLARGTSVPKMLFTTEDNARLAQIQPVISDIVDRYIATWVQEGASDASWDAYKAELEAAGVAELVSIFQNRVDEING